MKISLFLTAMLFAALPAGAQVFSGEKSDWHGFDRYDFVLNEKTRQIMPIKKADSEGAGVAAPQKGTRRCIVVTPKKAADGNPWSWRGCYWDHQPQAEVELLNRGFHIAYITTDPDETWDVWYDYLVDKGLSPKPAFIGMSRGGANSFTWGTGHPDKVLAICADNPGLSVKSLMNMDRLAREDVPVLNICGSIDPITRNTYAIQGVYQANGGRMSVLFKDGTGHHPHSLKDPAVIADFIETAYKEEKKGRPDFVPEPYEFWNFYSTLPNYIYGDKDKLWFTTWGPFFNGNAGKYQFKVDNTEGDVVVYVPENPKPEKKWVFRCDHPESTSAVDLSLLAKGYYIVVAPVAYNSDWPLSEQWNNVYEYLVGYGFDKKPVVAGRGGATGEMYVWAENNPGKVRGIYAENPIMRSYRPNCDPMSGIRSLSAAGVPVVHVCGKLDPNLDAHSRRMKGIYGAKMTLIEDAGRGHYPMNPDNPSQAVKLIEEMMK